MAQLRITKKFATDIKVGKLAEPSQVTAILDDWFIDVIRVHRKKVAVITHGESKLTFFVPYADVGGAKNIADCIPVLINQFLCDNDLDEHIEGVDRIFSSPPHYCKTVDRSVLSHMNNFKFAVEVETTHVNPNVTPDWDRITDRVQHDIISINKKDYSRPIDIIKNILVSPHNHILH